MPDPISPSQAEILPKPTAITSDSGQKLPQDLSGYLADLPPTQSSSRLGWLIIGHNSSVKAKADLEKAAQRILNWPLDYPSRVTVKRQSVEVNTECKLDTCIFTSPEAPKPPAGKYIINFNGNEESWQTRAVEAWQDAESLKCTAITFNYPGVGESTGSPSSQEELVKAGLAQVKYLLDQGIKPEQIILKGHSLGGAVATLVAAELKKKEDKEVYLFNGRSFSSLPSLVAGWAGRAIQPLARRILRDNNWEMNVTDAWLSIDNARKSYVYTRGDNVITDYGSLHRKLEKYRIHGTVEQKETLKDAPEGVELLVEEGESRKDNHILPLSKMRTKDGRIAEDIFHEFVTNIPPVAVEGEIALPKRIEEPHVIEAAAPTEEMDKSAVTSNAGDLLTGSNSTIGTGPRRVKLAISSAKKPDATINLASADPVRETSLSSGEEPSVASEITAHKGPRRVKILSSSTTAKASNALSSFTTEPENDKGLLRSTTTASSVSIELADEEDQKRVNQLLTKEILQSLDELKLEEVKGHATSLSPPTFFGRLTSFMKKGRAK